MLEHATVEISLGETQSQRRIIVSGEHGYNFALYHWRQAIRQYLACIWTGRFNYQDVADLEIPTHSPTYGGKDASVIVRYDAVTKRFIAFGAHDESLPPPLQHVRKEGVLRVSVLQPEQLEAALARFAWNRQMRALGIMFPNGPHIKQLWLWGGHLLGAYENLADN